MRTAEWSGQVSLSLTSASRNNCKNLQPVTVAIILGGQKAWVGTGKLREGVGPSPAEASGNFLVKILRLGSFYVSKMCFGPVQQDQY